MTGLAKRRPGRTGIRIGCDLGDCHTVYFAAHQIFAAGAVWLVAVQAGKHIIGACGGFVIGQLNRTFVKTSCPGRTATMQITAPEDGGQITGCGTGIWRSCVGAWDLVLVAVQTEGAVIGCFRGIAAYRTDWLVR